LSRTAFVVALAVVGMLGLVARLAPLRERHLPPEIRDLGASRWVVDDPGTALHLRRIELALAEGRVSQHDPFQAFAAPAEIPALPVFDALIAGSAERWLAHDGGDASLGGVDESDLEAFTAWIGPIAYVFGFAALAWAAWISARGRHTAVVLAAMTLALAPAAVVATEVGRLDSAALVLVLLALLVRGTQVAVRAEDALSVILEALLCGVIAGLLTSLSAAGPFLALPTGIALFLRAARGPAHVRPIAVRAGLLFCLSAAFISRLPLADGPWEHMPESLVARWALGASDVLLFSAAPFALMLLTAPRDAAHKSRTFARITALAAMLALLVFELPRGWNAASGPIEAWWNATQSIEFAEWFRVRALGVSIIAALGAGAAAVTCLNQRDPASVHRASLALATALLVVADPAFAPLFVVAGGLGFAGGLGSVAEPGTGANSRASLQESSTQQRWLLALAALVLGLPAVIGVVSPPSDAQRENRLAWISALRWIRTEVPPGGPFNSSSARSTWGILVDPGDGELVAYHARRPVLCSATGAFSHPDLAREAHELTTSASMDVVAGRMRAHGLQLAVQRGIHADPARFASEGLFAAARGHTDPSPLERVFASDAHVRLAGDERIPAAVIWSLGGEPAPRAPSVRPPR
jgi:hypothetical protein